MGRLNIIPCLASKSVQGIPYKNVVMGEFFKIDPNDCIKYRKDKFNFFAEKGEKGGAYNTCTGKHECIFGVVYLCDPMTEEEIKIQQKDHQMWGEIWRNHP